MIFSIYNLPIDYYVYMYCRNDGTPYYIGKGCKKRAWYRATGDTKPPSNKDLIKIVAHRLTEHEALLLEMKLIDLYGRKDIGTGILRNKTYGGDGAVGLVWSQESLDKRSDTRKNNNKPNPAKGRKMPEVVCPHCGLFGSGSTMSRYHFENCGKPKLPMKMYSCQKCGKLETKPNLNRYHNEKCGLPSANKGKTYSIKTVQND